MKIKSAAIPRAAFHYQDLVGIETLIRFFRDSQLYEWVELESEDKAARSLDDVIAKRCDGTFELTQVKFTVDADRYSLEWDWLLDKSDGGTSLLGKWSRAFARVVERGPVHSATLCTNRVASQAFEACLVGGRVDLARLSPDLRARVEAECGGVTAAASFFNLFTFSDGRPNLPAFEASLRDLLVPHDTDAHGWLLLQDEVRRWATNRGQPHPDGRILHEHLVQIISRKRPRALRQDFRVPDGYEPPLVAFNAKVRARLAASGGTTILWGSPGRGKSTYISYLAESLQKEDAVVLRHHYFLPGDDVTVRTSYFEVAASLVDQLTSRYPAQSRGVSGEAHDLRSDLARVAASLERPMYVIVDGLDHVWRDTQRVDQLDHLFNVLLPLPPNMHLIVGTQRVSGNQLPTRMLSLAREDDWVEIPPMEEAAVHRWLQRQDADRLLVIEEGYHPRSERVDEIAAALSVASGGHPLYLIYALESLIRLSRPIDADAVRQLPSCPDGNIITYYAGLWSRIDAASRDILHGLAGSGFFWPAFGIRQCFGPHDAVAFLLEPRRGGMVPFHASLFAWVRERPDHADAIVALLPKISAWLETDAPPYWRWGWLWLIQARVGKSDPLSEGANRAWAVDSLGVGWPDAHLSAVFSMAERQTFEQGDFPRTLTQRGVKTRLANAPDYQARNYPLFRAVAIEAAANWQQLGNHLDAIASLGEADIAALARYTRSPFNAEVHAECLAELRRRIRTWIDLRHRPGDEFEGLVRHYIDVLAIAGEGGFADKIRFLRGFRDPGPYFERYVDRLAEAGMLEGLHAIRLLLGGKRWTELRRRCDVEMLRAAWRAQANPDTLKLRRASTEPIFAARHAWLGRGRVKSLSATPLPQPLRGDGQQGSAVRPTETFFADIFWTTLYAERSGDTAAVAPFAVMNREAGWIVEAIDCLMATARDVARGDLPCDMSALYAGAGAVAEQRRSSPDDREMFDYFSFRKSLLSIGLDLQMLGGEADRQPLVSGEALASARGSVHWADEVFLEQVADKNRKLLDPAAARLFADELADRFSSELSEFNERAEYWTWLAAFALAHSLDGSGRFVRRAADCLLGYGYRRDTSVIDAIESVEAVAIVTGANTGRWLRKLAPFVEAMHDFTDGDGSDFVRSTFIRVMASTKPDFLPRTYRHHLSRDDWSLADKVLRNALKLIKLDSSQGRALASTITDHAALRVLQERGVGDPNVASIFERQLDFLGGMPIPPRERQYTPMPPDDPKAVAAALPSKFPPGRFAQFVKVAGERGVGFETKRRLNNDWLRHWAAKGKALPALRAIETHLIEQESGTELDELLDTAFDVSLDYEGMEAAWPWIVRAHVHRRGWSSDWSGKEAILARLEKIAKHYPDRWQTFIAESSAPPPYWARQDSSFSIGHKYLVRFLVMIGQTERAVAATDALIDGLIAEISDQPVGATSWLT